MTLLGACVDALSPTHADLAREETQRATFNAAGSTVVLLATLAGLISVTSEFRYGTIRPTLLFEPRRRVVLGAKLVAAALAGVLFAIACVAVAFGAGLGILALRKSSSSSPLSTRSCSSSVPSSPVRSARCWASPSGH
jgi:hypothetical protein